MTPVDFIYPNTNGKVGPGSVLTPSQAGVLVYADGVNFNPGQGAGWYLWNGTAYKKLATSGPDYDSGDQTITVAGALTLAHGLGVRPSRVEVWLHNITAEQGYSAGDFVYFTMQDWNFSVSMGVIIVADSTNLNIRYANETNVFYLLNKTTGVGAAITLANWKAVFRAWI